MMNTYRFLLALLAAASATVLAQPAASTPASALTDSGYRVLEQYPHNPVLFTQGLELYKNRLFESTGLYGHSKVISRRFPPQADPDLKGVALPDTAFAEGLTLYRDRLYLLTWRAQKGLILDAEHFGLLGSFSYEGEGWGLCFQRKLGEAGLFVMSNGSDQLQLLSPDTMKKVGHIRVTDNDAPVERLNELECVGNYIVANIWHSNDIVFIDANSGQVKSRVDLSALKPKVSSDQAVLNGIAFDEQDASWLVTGKLWPVMYRLHIPLPTAQ